MAAAREQMSARTKDSQSSFPARSNGGDQERRAQDHPDDSEPRRGAVRDRPPSSGDAETKAAAPTRTYDAVADEEADQRDSEEQRPRPARGGEDVVVQRSKCDSSQARGVAVSRPGARPKTRALTSLDKRASDVARVWS